MRTCHPEKRAPRESADQIRCLDIELNTKGTKTLYDSFRDYVAVKMLDGEFKHNTKGFGLQDAWKSAIFQSLPPVLHLRLKRHEHDVQRDAIVKVSIAHLRWSPV